MKQINFEGKDLDNLVNEYRKLKSISKLALKLGISRSIVSRELKKAIIVDRRYYVKYTCDHDFFSRDTPDSFYWAGFIAADGCVKKNGGNHVICINLAEKDCDHLEKFKHAIKYTGKIEKVMWGKNKGVSVRISSLKMFEDLKRFNIVPRKTYSLTFLDWLKDHKLVSHFMRGFFDGDGSLYKQGKSKSGNISSQIVFEVVCYRKQFLECFKDILIKNNIIKCSKVARKHDLYRIVHRGNIIVPKIMLFLYNDSNKQNRLDRKHFLFANHKIENLTHRSVIGTNLITGERIILSKIVDCVNFGFSHSHISSCCRGHRKTHLGFTWKYKEKGNEESLVEK